MVQGPGLRCQGRYTQAQHRARSTTMDERSSLMVLSGIDCGGFAASSGATAFRSRRGAVFPHGRDSLF